MRIDYERSGGFANIQLSCHLNTESMPQDQAEELLKLVESSRVFDIQQNDIRFLLGNDAQGFIPVRSLSHNIESFHFRKQANQASPEQGMIVHHYDSDFLAHDFAHS